MFATDWRLLMVVWAVCGLGALGKSVLGIYVEAAAMLSYVGLGLAPLGLVRPAARAYPFLVLGISIIALGGVFGYMNNAKGGTPFWHVCVLAASILNWVLVYGTAKHGVPYYL